MRADEAVLFAGDPLAFATRHHLPACMHRPDALIMAGAQAELARRAGGPGGVANSSPARISTPCFLYPDLEAALDSSRTRPELSAAEGGPLPTPRPARLPVEHFQRNLGGCRDRWPWKGSAYYRGLVIASDDDPFPGEPPG